jgi:hypothetical protein
MRSFPLARILAMSLVGCSGAPQTETSFAAVAVPTGTKELVVEGQGITVAFDVATVALGAVYFCASASGSANLCDAAQGEVLQASAIDALDSSPQPLGLFHGFTGDIRSASFDYGIHWYMTEKQATPAPAAPFGHSMHVEGRATQGATSARFTADVDVRAPFQGERAVPTTKTAGTVDEDTARLEARFDAASWFSGVDWAAVLAAGQVDHAIVMGSPDHDAIVIDMVAVRPPTFVFVKAAGP